MPGATAESVISLTSDRDHNSWQSGIGSLIRRFWVSDMTVGAAAHLTMCRDAGRGAHGGDACRWTRLEGHVRMARTKGITCAVGRPIL